MQDLITAAVQADIRWERIEENLEAFGRKIGELRNNPDLVILPEMFSTGFSMNSAVLAEKMDGPSMQWMADQAARCNAIITGSLIIEENRQYYNRLIWMRPDGTHEHYDKRHLFRMMGEDHSFAAGVRKIIVELRGWRICPLICYDLRFPVWSRNTGDYDCLIYIANWPEPRRDAWKTLLRARAHENQSYVIGVNRVGEDGNGVPFAGDSVMLDPRGTVISEASGGDTAIEGSFSYAALEEFRSKFPVRLDADRFTLEF